MFRAQDRAAGLGQRLWQAALDLLYPPRCLACDALVDVGVNFCPPCAATLVPIDRACPRCAVPLPSVPGARPPPCLNCLFRPPRVLAAVAAFEFGGALAEAVRRLKWQRMPELAPPLGGLLEAAAARAPPVLGDIDLIAPVPLHRRRLRAREFNQAA